MKRYSALILFLSSLLLNSCEKDDICVLPTTPKLIIRFYDNSDPENTKEVENLTVSVEAADSTIYDGVTTDSIAIPLDVNSTQTIYNLSRGDVQDQLQIDYEIEEIFVSRSCGFKANFNNLSISSTNNWIQSFEIISSSITSENSAHVQIRH